MSARAHLAGRRRAKTKFNGLGELFIKTVRPGWRSPAMVTNRTYTTATSQCPKTSPSWKHVDEHEAELWMADLGNHRSRYGDQIDAPRGVELDYSDGFTNTSP
jgi:hypothetical protein